MKDNSNDIQISGNISKYHKPGNFLACAKKWKKQRHSIIRGNLQIWLAETKAQPTKDPSKFIIEGWNVVFISIKQELLDSMHSMYKTPESIASELPWPLPTSHAA